MVSERSILTLDIGGDSQQAVDAANAVAAALEHLNTTLTSGEQAQTRHTEAASHSNSILSELTGTLRTVNPEMGGLATATNEVIGGGETGLLGIASAGAVAVGVIAELGAQGGKLLTELNQLAAVTGLSVERVDFWSKAMADVGGNAQTLSRTSILLQNSIEGINNAMEKGSDLNQKQRDVLNLLNGSIHDETGALLSSGQALETLIPRLAAVTDANERSRLGIETFGRSWGAIAPLVANFAQVQETAERQSARLARTLGTDSANAMIEYNSRMTDIKTTMEIVELRTLPTLVGALDTATSALDRMLGPLATSISGWATLIGLADKLPDWLKGPFAGGSSGGADRNGVLVSPGQVPVGPGPAFGKPGQQGIDPSDALSGYNQAVAAAAKLVPDWLGNALKSIAVPTTGPQSVGDLFKAGEAAAKQQEEAVKKEAEASKKAAEQLDKFNDALGKTVQGFLGLDAIKSAVQALFGGPTREQADLQLSVDEQKAFKAKYGPDAVHFGAGQGVGTAGNAEQRLAQLDAAHKVEQDRITAANTLLITEGQQAKQAEALRQLTADQSTLLRDKLNPSIDDLYPTINTAKTAFVGIRDFLNNGMSDALLGFARKLSDFQPPTLAPAAGSTGGSSPTMTAGG